MTVQSYIGKGKVWVEPEDSDEGERFLGNCPVLNLPIAEDKKSLVDFTQGGGGEYDAKTRISSVGCEISFNDLSPANTAMVVFGSIGVISPATVTDENVGTGYAGRARGTLYPIDTDETVTVEHGQTAAAERQNSHAYSLGDYYTPATPNGYVYKVTTAGTSAGSPPSFGTTVGGTTVDGAATVTNVGKQLLVANTDYIVSAGGIELDDAPAFYDGEDLLVTYTKAASHRVLSLTNAAKVYRVRFDGLNEAGTMRPVLVKLFRVKFGPTDGINFIGDEFFEGKMTGSVLKDASRNGTSESQYFEVTYLD